MSTTLDEAIATGQEVTPLLLARALLHMQWDIQKAQSALAHLDTRVECLTDETYKLAGYEKKATGGYGPVEKIVVSKGGTGM